MIKKIILAATLLFPFLAVKAQQGVGSWEIYTAFSEVSDLVETPDKVYYLSAGYLYSYDKAENESYSYTVNNKLHDSGIKMIRYNPEGGYLAVIYTSANIDLIYDDGKVVNMSDISDAVMNVTPVINAVDFSNGRMAVATNFGLVLFDDKRHEVIESGMYGMNVATVALSPNYVFFDTSDGTVKAYVMELRRHITNLDNAYIFDRVAQQDATAINDNTVAVIVSKNNKLEMRLIKYDYDNLTRNVETIAYGTKLYKSKNYVYSYDDTQITSVDKDLNVLKTAIPSDFKGEKLGYWSDAEKIWAGSSKGIGHYDISGSAITVLQDRFKPEALTSPKMERLRALRNGGVGGWQASWGRPFTSNGNWGGSWNYNVVNGESPINDGVVPGTNIGDILESPNLSGVCYVSLWNAGFKKIENGEDLGVVVKPGDYCGQMDYDSRGNIYICSGFKNDYHIKMLPKDKELQYDNVDSWVGILLRSEVPSFNDIYHQELLVCKKSNMVFRTHRWNRGFNLIDTKGTDTNSDDRTAYINQIEDQDGRVVNWGSCETICFAEDHNGDVWIGSSVGIVRAYNLKAGIENVKYSHVKVPRNDGTGLADYLLDSETISDIAVDSSNRKWISTLNGVYLVSADGSEILEHFTSDNSDLPSNTIYAVECDTQNNAVYFGNSQCMIKYNSDAAPAADDFSEVYAYPNPVRPEYTGWIIIKNLMDNSLVKIADSAGNVFFQGKSEGGMLSWDGCDSSGNRVKTGVYYVFASNSNDGGNMSAVTKILVVQ